MTKERRTEGMNLSFDGMIWAQALMDAATSKRERRIERAFSGVLEKNEALEQRVKEIRFFVSLRMTGDGRPVPYGKDVFR